MKSDSTSAPTPPKPYLYSHQDRSILEPYLKRFVWSRLHRLVPGWLSPNTLTLFSGLAALVTFGLCVALPPRTSFLWLLPALTTFLHLAFDNLDGMQARRQGRSSRFGEFFDHWCDSLNFGLFLFGIAVALRPPHWTTFVGLSLGQLAFFATHWEHGVTGRLLFGRLGPTEAATLIILLLVLVPTLGFEAVARRPLCGPFPLFALVLMGSSAFFLIVTLRIMVRVGRRPLDLVSIVLVDAALGLWVAVGRLPPLWWGSLTLLAGASFCGRMVADSVLQQPLRPQDWVLCLLVASAAAVSLHLGQGGQCLLATPVFLLVAYRLGSDFHAAATSRREDLQPTELLGRLLSRRR